MAWREVEEDIPDGQEEEVEVDKVEGGISIKVKEMRKPKQKVTKWVVEVNKGFSVKQGASGNGNGSKRAITIEKREGNTISLVGNFRSGEEGAKYLNIPTGVSSANKVLRDDGFLVTAYEGTNFTN